MAANGQGKGRSMRASARLDSSLRRGRAPAGFVPAARGKGGVQGFLAAVPGSGQGRAFQLGFDVNTVSEEGQRSKISDLVTLFYANKHWFLFSCYFVLISVGFCG